MLNYFASIHHGQYHLYIASYKLKAELELLQQQEIIAPITEATE